MEPDCHSFPQSKITITPQFQHCKRYRVNQLANTQADVLNNRTPSQDASINSLQTGKLSDPSTCNDVDIADPLLPDETCEEVRKYSFASIAHNHNDS